MTLPLSPIPEAGRIHQTPVCHSDFDARLRFARRHSRYLDQLLTARPAIEPWLVTHAQQTLTASTLLDFLTNTLAQSEVSGSDEALQQALRGLRQRVMAHLIVRDIADGASLAEIVETMTLLADVTTRYALDHLHFELVKRYGAPCNS